MNVLNLLIKMMLIYNIHKDIVNLYNNYGIKIYVIILMIYLIY